MTLLPQYTLQEEEDKEEEEGEEEEEEEEEEEPVAQRHQMVSGSLALLFIGLELPLGSRAATPIGDKVL